MSNNGRSAREVIAHAVQMGWHANADAYEIADQALSDLSAAEYLVVRDSFAEGQ